MRDFVAYAQFGHIWDRFLPETPFGRAEKEAMTLQTDPAALMSLWDETDRALELLDALEGDAVRLSRIQHHLKRLPRFCEDSKAIYDEVEIFQFKKFLHNYKSLAELLDADLRRCFAMGFASEALEQLLDQGRQSAESFYVADAYSATLRELRAEIRETDTAIRTLRERRAAEIQGRWSFAFGDRAFLLVPRESLGSAEAASEWLLVEPYDGNLYAVRPRSSAEELVLLERRSRLLARERSAEEEVLETLSHALRSELSRFAEYRRAITRFDLAFARARLARELRLVRPELGDGAIAVRAGRFLPCEESCARLGTDYVPLDAVFDTRATVIFGSNMGGKTVVLKTLAFLQLCVQMGLYVPAAAYATRLFHHFHYLGEGRAAQPSQGLGLWVRDPRVRGSFPGFRIAHPRALR
jgi:dsDNA-specific endonuclease/ATPase MutS2